jgi:DNA mismatch endonuclease (patch repair protein)
MSRVQSKDTTPELAVRRMVHALGYRYRLHRRDLPGTPDIVLPRHRAVIFVHGCFWHLHRCQTRVPKANASYWAAKRLGNVKRDGRNARALRRAGWRVMVVWECDLRTRAAVQKRLARFLGHSISTSPATAPSLTTDPPRF